MDLTRPKITNIQSAFDRLPEDGPQVDRIAGRVRAKGAYSHVQGVIGKAGRYIFTHADQHRESGRLLVASQADLALSAWASVLPFSTNLDEPFFAHAGGCQNLGDLLVVACETIGKSQRSMLAFFDISVPEQPVELERLRIIRDDSKAMAAGITTHTHDGSQRYLVATYEHGQVDFYSSIVVGSAWVKMSKSLEVREQRHQAFLLFTDSAENIFAIGLNHGATEFDWSNWAILYRLHFDRAGAPCDLERLARKTFRTHDGAALRWGASVEAVSNEKLVLYCTAKNFAKRCCVLNTFDPETPSELRATGRGTVTFIETRAGSRGSRAAARESSFRNAQHKPSQATRTRTRATRRTPRR